MDRERAREVYADIIDLPHHQSEKRPHMSLYDRAAQFSPFAALTGYGDMVREEARLTDPEQERSETEREVLDRRLRQIGDSLAEQIHPEITVEYFIPDARKAGGRYERKTGIVKRIDAAERRLVFYEDNLVTAGQTVPLDAVRRIEGSLFGDAD